MVKCDDVVAYCNQLLDVDAYQDYCPNGLQVAGKDKVGKIVTAVTASLDCLQQALAAKADLLLVHHGYFWRGEDMVLTGMRRERIKCLLDNDINLLCYHLPLDGHPIYGNNVQLAERLQLKNIRRLPESDPYSVLFVADSPKPVSSTTLAENLTNALGREPLVIAPNQDPIKSIAICTGAAQDYIELAATEGCDAFITGEVSERTFHQANELNIHFFAAGHHATERYGIQALGEQVAKQFKLIHEFIDIPNPV